MSNEGLLSKIDSQIKDKLLMQDHGFILEMVKLLSKTASTSSIIQKEIISKLN